MNKIFFIFGYIFHSWDEWGSSTSIKLKSIIEITKSEPTSILEDVKKELLSAIEKNEIKKELIYGGAGDLGGSSHKFYGEFFTNNDSEKETVMELNQGFQKILGDIFILPKN